MKKKDIVQALVDHFEITRDWESLVTDENLEEWLSSYDFVSWCYLGYHGPRLSLGEVVRALEWECDEW